MRLRGLIDCLIPRGGPSLIQAILEHATVPYVIDGDGNCHVYVDAAADLDMALAIVVNAKTQRPSVCNAAESLVVHQAVAGRFLPLAAAALDGVELVGDGRAREIVGPDRMGPATDEDFSQEFLDLKLSVAVVDDLDAAIDHIRRHGSGPHRGDRHLRPGGGHPVHHRGGRRRRRGQRLDPVHRRRGVRLRGRDRHQHPEAARPGPHGPAGAHHHQVHRPRRGPDPHMSDLDTAPRFASVPEVREGLRSVQYLADEGIAGVVYLADRLGKPVLVEGPAGHRQDPAGQVGGRDDRRPGSSGCSATRASTSPRRCTSGTTRSSCCASRPSGSPRTRA